MKRQVHLLAFARKFELLDAARMVFKTLRAGFPSADVIVWGNGLSSKCSRVIAHDCATVSARFIPGPYQSHDAWIERLLQIQEQPFWVCDTDMVFLDKVEDWFPGGVRMAGRFEPQFVEAFTDTVHVNRLHTCLMLLDPKAIRIAMRTWMCRVPPPWRGSAQFPLIRQTIVPRLDEKPLFYDTCAGLYHAFGGTSFTEEQNACFEHLHCGTYADLIEKSLGLDLTGTHQRIYANPAAAVGLQKGQQQYYESRSELALKGE